MPFTTVPASLDHFVIFNPTIKLPDTPRDDTERDKDLEDDLREAAQILFYTSRGSGGVSRDKMLRQTGLIKGIMGFTDMVVKDDGRRDFWSVRSHKSRLIVYVPEPDFYIYVNVTLAQTIPEEGKEPSTSQGLSDHKLVDALTRGYEDFRLLHGTLTGLLPPSPALSSTLDKFWTRFAFSFESTHITPPSPDPTSLSTWITESLLPPEQLASGAERAMEVFREDADCTGDMGVVNKDGFLHSTIHDPPLERFLTGLVQASLPPPIVELPKADVRGSLGFGLRRREEGARKTSWATFSSAAVGWVPTLGGGTPRSVTPVDGETEKPAAETNKPRWSFGMPTLGIGEAMGTVGTVFGLGGLKPDGRRDSVPQGGASGHVSPAGTNPNGSLEEGGTQDAAPNGEETTSGTGAISNEATKSSIEAVRPLSLNDEPSTEQASTLHDDTASDQASSRGVTQTAVDIPDLQDAVEPETEVELGWEQKTVWMHAAESWAKRRLIWIIRDGILLFVLFPTDLVPPYPTPSARVTLSLYSRLDSLLSPERGSTDSTRPTQAVLANPSIHLAEGRAEKRGEMDAMSATALAELTDIVRSDPSINEVYARTHASKFVVAKRTWTGHSDDRPGQSAGELYMVVGRKDASLTDAEYAVRGYMRSRPELV